MLNSLSKSTRWDVQKIRKEFPGLEQVVHGNKQLVYLDNAATTQKPQVVLDTLIDYYRYSNANVHRAIHILGDRATEALEETRKAVQKFINAPEAEEIIFTSGTTASINLVASSYGQRFIQAGDEIIISHMEHHANLVPWQMLCQSKGANLKVIPIHERGELDMDAFERLLSSKTKLVAITYVSNNLGTINPIQEMIAKAHTMGAIVLTDAAQAVPHFSLDVQELDCDFLAFSAHKAYGPTGVGILYGKRALLESMSPYQGGGEMIKEVTLSKSTYNDIPYKFEAGTPNIANIIAFKAALKFIQDIGWDHIKKHEENLTKYTQKLIGQLDRVRLIGTAPDKVGIVSFVIDSMHHLDVGMLLDAQGIAVRTGYGCSQPLIQSLGLDGIIRVSLAMYNTVEEIDYLVGALTKLIHKN
ncbi:MAG: cysteine sulfinate desulfinase [Candidatus Amoebophilus sp. 36-38]|nr:MAG: cysteine sulfinate desulfinase [Candidatus Amoebophilus sp. 36-38]